MEKTFLNFHQGLTKWTLMACLQDEFDRKHQA